MTSNNEEHTEFIEGIAAPLRAPERLDDTFEARVLSAVHAEARAGRAPSAGTRARLAWWREPRLFYAAPMRMLSYAVALVIATLAVSQAVRSQAREDGAAAAADTVHLVRFVLVAPDARAVSLVGDFNAWSKDATRLTAQGGAWMVSLPLPAGRYEYAFIVENEAGQTWVADPFAASVRDEFDTESSVIMLGSAASLRSRRSAS